MSANLPTPKTLTLTLSQARQLDALNRQELPATAFWHDIEQLYQINLRGDRFNIVSIQRVTHTEFTIKTSPRKLTKEQIRYGANFATYLQREHKRANSRPSKFNPRTPYGRKHRMAARSAPQNGARS